MFFINHILQLFLVTFELSKNESFSTQNKLQNLKKKINYKKIECKKNIDQNWLLRYLQTTK